MNSCPRCVPESFTIKIQILFLVCPSFNEALNIINLKLDVCLNHYATACPVKQKYYVRIIIKDLE
jgi:hypothetical protein